MQRTGSLLVPYGGSTNLANLPAAFKTTVEEASKSLETKVGQTKPGWHLSRLRLIPEKYPKVTEARIHRTRTPVIDQQDVITVSYHTDKGTPVTSVHAHDDNTGNEFPSRNAGKGK
ncbi:hypothetical protein CSOJ01_13566 [Colletotrichum sojae]|uniref:Uncharacterized protein n=1 Tax=Colletotrichum sojae TaxID=2175907 RepID=A0A8H6ML76_9PEZI|nr:hypothetical protein CSOJ01_13566 [Colletotrichum sojae]